MLGDGAFMNTPLNMIKNGDDVQADATGKLTLTLPEKLTAVFMHGGKLVVIRKDYFFYVRFAEHSSCFRINRSGRRNRIFAEIGNVCADFNRD